MQRERVDGVADEPLPELAHAVMRRRPAEPPQRLPSLPSSTRHVFRPGPVGLVGAPLAENGEGCQPVWRGGRQSRLLALLSRAAAA
jgi:hypothetical protein